MSVPVLLLLCLAPSATPAQAAVAQNEPLAGLAELRAFAGRYEDELELWRGWELELSAIAATLVEAARREPARVREVSRHLLDLAGWNLQWLPDSGDFRGQGLAGIRGVGRSALSVLLEGSERDALYDWLADEVLVLPERHSTSRRYVALHLLNEERTEKARMAMLTIARNELDGLRPDVLTLLPTWPEESVDLFLVGLLRKKHDPKRRPHPFNLVLQRVRDSHESLGVRASEALSERLAFMLISTDWREASRAIELGRGLDIELRVPLLLDALLIWHKRDLRGTGNKRILHEVLRELRRISGRSVGKNPKNWITWWIAYRQGRVALPDEGSEPEESRTRATFFGLGPISDRVTFVIDHSGSMDSEWGTTGHSRYEEAIEQMMRYLQASGERTRFNVILFSDEPLRSSETLVQAGTRTLEVARSSLLERPPGGSTRLRPAIELALSIGAGGHVDLERLEADTIIVLCDGETSDGSGWVRPMLERTYADARVVFHCVVIGSRGDGTLELLAESTGGEYLRIGG